MGWLPTLVDLTLRRLVEGRREKGLQDLRKSSRQNIVSIDNFKRLPPHLKDGLRDGLLKRQELSPEELGYLLHPAVRDIDLQDQRPTDDLLRVLSQVKTFKRINLNQGSTPASLSTAALVELLTGQRYLQSFFIRGLSNVTVEVFATLSSCCPNLLHLDVSRCPDISDEHLNTIRGCRRLESLSLAATNVSDLALHHVASGESRDRLKELRIDRCRNITDDGIGVLLDGLSKLEILIFHGCPQVTSRSRIILEEYLSTPQRNVRQLTWTVY